MASLHHRQLSPDPTAVARRLLDRHGLRAAAVASEYVSEASAAGDAAALHHARQVQSAIAELRANARHGVAHRHAFA